MNTHDASKKIVEEIIKDLTSRSGLDGAWHNTDLETRKEIQFAWEQMAQDILLEESQ